MALPAETRYPTAAAKVSSARIAFQNGARQRAYQLSLEATQMEPRNIDAWLIRAWTTRSLDETLACLSRVIALDPQHPVAQQGLYQSLQRLLQQDGFLAYVGENDAAYYIRTSSGLLLTVPKERRAVEPYPPSKPSPLRGAYRWLALAMVGLPLAGVGALLFAPLAMTEAARVRKQVQDPADRIRAWAVMGLSLILFLGSLPLVFLFLVHL